MPKTEPFEKHHSRYEDWFQKHQAAYVSELLALRKFIPIEGRGIEIGVGSGRFAVPLGISTGIDPSRAMLKYAAARGIQTNEAVAEHLPFADNCFDTALIVTTICFVDSPSETLKEAHRVLGREGRVVIGFIDRESVIGRGYLKHQHESDFYRDATFFSAEEIGKLLLNAGFMITDRAQTLAHSLNETTEIEALQPGCGKCAFVVISAEKKG